MTDLPTTERLARDLEREGLPQVMVERARAGFYDDYHPNASPFGMVSLHSDLLAAGRDDMAVQVTEGKWDGTVDEAAAWAQSAEGQEAFRDLLLGKAAAAAKQPTPSPSWSSTQRPSAPTPAEAAMSLVERMKSGVGGWVMPGDVADIDMLLAAVGMVLRCGGAMFEIGYDDPDGEVFWWAEVTIDERVPSEAAGRTMRVAGYPNPEGAAEALARALMENGTCQHCHSTVRLGGDPGGSTEKVCRYHRVGTEWKRGCE